MAEWLSGELSNSKSQLNENLSYIAQDYLSCKMQKLFKENNANTSETIIQLIHSTLTVEEKAELVKRLSSSMEENPKLSMEQLSKSIDDNLEDNASSDDNKDSSQNSEN